jgi:hypothetical protein
MAVAKKVSGDSIRGGVISRAMLEFTSTRSTAVGDEAKSSAHAPNKTENHP